MEYGGEESKKRKVDEENKNGSSLQLSKDDIKALLEPLSKEQLVDLLADV